MKRKPDIRRITRSGLIRAMTCIANEETVYTADCKKKGCPYAGTDCSENVIADVLYLLTNGADKPAEPPEEEPRINPNCRGLGYDNCEICDFPCPYR